jgi:hypothetical protein
VKFAYADPPYLGCGMNHYGEHHPDAADYDRVETHAVLISRLCSEYDGWALSLHTPSLKTMLNFCPDDVRIGAWVKPFASFKPNVNPAYAWEPVIFRGARERGKAWREGRGAYHVRDWVSASIMGQHARSKVTVDGKTFGGAKPDAFCWWVFDLLGLEPDDEFHDIFPGSGAVGRAWQEWRRADRAMPLFREIKS